MFKKYLKNAGFLVIQSVVSRIIGFILSPLIARGFSPYQFGVYTLITNTAESGFNLCKLGIDAALHVYLAEKGSKDKDLLKQRLIGAGLLMSIITGLVSAVGVFFFSDIIAQKLFKDGSLGYWIKFSAFIMFLRFLYQYYYAILAGLHQFKSFALVTTLIDVIKLVLMSIAVFYKSLVGLIAVLIILNFLAIVLMHGFARRALMVHNYKILYEQKKKSVLAILKVGTPFHLASILPIFLTYYFQGRLSSYIGIEAFGYLRVATAFNSLLSFLPASIAAATVSAFSELHSENKADNTHFLKYTFTNTKIVWIYGLLFVMPVQCLLPILVPLLFGQDYAPAIQISQFMLFNAVFSLVSTSVSQIFFAEKKTWFIMFQSIIGSLLFALFCYFLLPIYGLNGYAYSLLSMDIVNISLLLIVLYQKSRHSGVKFTELFLLYGLSLGTVIFALWGYPLAKVLGYLLFSQLLLTIIVFVFIYFWVVTNEEKQYAIFALRSLGNKIKKGTIV